MAKRKRRRNRARALPPQERAPAKKKPHQEKQLYHGDMVASMDPPNHLMRDEVAGKRQRAMGVSRNTRWPLSQLLRKEDSGQTVGVFVHPRHGCDHWSQWADNPPTWMDPHLLADLAKQDPQVARELDRAFKANDPCEERLLPLLKTVFEEQYLVFAIQEFNRHALRLIAQWLLRSHADRKL